MQSAARSYFQTQVSTTTQGDLVIMLYDAALKFLHQAKEKIAQKDYAQKGILISKTMDILSELQGSLNAQKGGDLADRLQKLYFFCNSRLLLANLKMDVSIIADVERILSGLRDAFAQANAQVATKVVPTSATQTTAPHMAPATPQAPITLPRAMAYQKQAGAAPTSDSPAPGQATAEPAADMDIAPSPTTPNPTRMVRQVAANTQGTPVPRARILPGSTNAGKPTPVQRVMAAYAATRKAG